MNITVDGVTKTVEEWSEISDTKVSTIISRRKQQGKRKVCYTGRQIVGLDDLPKHRNQYSRTNSTPQINEDSPKERTLRMIRSAFLKTALVEQL
jgi:hypothetical protein